jgi:lipid-binding SYLF domain-containing protein
MRISNVSLRKISVVSVLSLLLSMSAFAATDAQLRERAEKASDTLDLVMGSAQRIPQNLLDVSTCIASFPDVAKAGFILGYLQGQGLVSCRTDAGWSRPSYAIIKSPSAGFQFGVEVSDIVIVFVGDHARTAILHGDFTFGGDLGATAGPIGATNGAGASPKAGIYTYAISRGLMVDVSINGLGFGLQRDDNRQAYNDRSISAPAVLHSVGPAPAFLQEFQTKIMNYAK